MGVEEAREFAVGLMEMASHMVPSQMLVVKYRPPGAKYVRHKKVAACEILPFASAVLRACREAERGTLFAGVGE